MAIHPRLMKSTPRERRGLAIGLSLAAVVWFLASYMVDRAREPRGVPGCLTSMIHLGYDEWYDRCHAHYWTVSWDVWSWTSVVVGMALIGGAVAAISFALSFELVRELEAETGGHR